MKDNGLKPIAQEVVNILSTRYDGRGEIKMLALADGYVMFKRRGSWPGVMTLEDWMKLSETSDGER